MGSQFSLTTILLLLSAILIALGSAPPYFAFGEPQALRTESEGKNVELMCPVTGDPPPLIQWSVNAVPLHELRPSERRLLLDGGRVLRVHDLNHDLDSGLYQCNASNFHGHVATSVYLKVESFAPYFRTALQRVWKTIHHSDVYLDCAVEAAPAADIRWADASDSSITPVPNKLEIFDNATLRIADVSNADEGYYYCNVSNKYGINRAMNKLEVYGATYFVEIPSPSRVVVDAGNAADFRCRAQADPRLTVTYLWTQNGRTLNATLDESGTSIMKLAKVRGEFSGRIDCAAVTDVDVKLTSVEFIVRDIPSSPQLLKVECGYGAQQRALIIWQRPLENGAPITHFTVETANAFQPGEWEMVYTERSLDRDIFKLILPLSPWMNYTFRVTAHNVLGPGDAAQSAESVCMTHEDVPHTNPRDVSAFGTEPGNLVIRWRAMDKRDWNAPGLRYLVRYRQHDSAPATKRTKIAINAQNRSNEIIIEDTTPSWRSVARNAWHEIFFEDSLMNETIVRDLPIFAIFDVQVRAVNSRGYSAIQPLIVSGFSGEDIPEVAPGNLRFVEFSNFSTAILAWDAVPSESIHGHFKGYKVKYWLTGQPYFAEHAFADNRSLRVDVGGLSAMRNYSAVVYVLNGRYESAPSNQLQFMTPEGAPSKVHDLRVSPVGSRSILVTWQPPLRPNGNIRGYFLEFENSTSSAVEETYILHRQHYYLHVSLEPDSPYRVSVWAETNGGEGPPVIRPVRTWPIRKPDPPSFSIRPSSPFSANVEWLPSGGNSTRWLFSGTNFYVKYRSTAEKENWMESEIVTLPFTTLEITNLTENTDYEFVGVARESTELSVETAPLSFRTDSLHSISLVNTERLRSVAWFLVVLIALALVLLTIGLMCCLAQHRYGFYDIRIRDKHFRQYESIGRGRGESLRSGSSGTVTTEVAAFFDDQSDEHRRFLAASAGELRRASKHREADTENRRALAAPAYLAATAASQPQAASHLRVRMPSKCTVKLPSTIEDRLPDEDATKPTTNIFITVPSDEKIEAKLDEGLKSKAFQDKCITNKCNDSSMSNAIASEAEHWPPKAAISIRPIRNTESTTDLQLIGRLKTFSGNESTSTTATTSSDTLKSDYDTAATLRISDTFNLPFDQ